MFFAYVVLMRLKERLDMTRTRRASLTPMPHIMLDIEYQFMDVAQILSTGHSLPVLLYDLVLTALPLPFGTLQHTSEQAARTVEDCTVLKAT